MSLGAMMAGGGQQFANSVDLLSASPWVVPGGVTALNVFAATDGGGTFIESISGNFGGSGGGGALILGAVATVTPSETLSVNIAVPGAFVEYTVVGSVTGPIFTIRTGENAGQNIGAVRNGGNGGSVSWVPTTQSAGIGALVNVTGGGILVGGGNGGTGGVTPSTLGTAGGASGGGLYPAVAAGANYGGGGGGYFPGDAWLTNTPTQTNTRGATFIRVRY